jgi:uncharacterized membrane protein YbaN (DUF454 family)
MLEYLILFYCVALYILGLVYDFLPTTSSLSIFILCFSGERETKKENVELNIDDL